MGARGALSTPTLISHSTGDEPPGSPTDDQLTTLGTSTSRGARGSASTDREDLSEERADRRGALIEREGRVSKRHSERR
jgi:hypothetical protein